VPATVLFIWDIMLFITSLKPENRSRFFRAAAAALKAGVAQQYKGGEPRNLLEGSQAAQATVMCHD